MQANPPDWMATFEMYFAYGRPGHMILYAIGTGPVRGFAVTLSIGIMTSMFTAVVVTRALANLVYGGRRLTKISI